MLMCPCQRSRMILGLIFFVWNINNIIAHGRLRIPAQRSSLWRDHLSSVINTNDNEINCGGFWVHHELNKNKCGTCGDSYSGIQHHQPPGKYAQGIISQCYRPGTDWIDVKVEITANHLGYFQFKLCANNDIHTPANKSCFDSNMLSIRNSRGDDFGVQFPVTAGMFDVYLKVKLPEDIECSQCILQWTYVSGNNWGCSEGYCGLGQGVQETFVNCADIAVTDDCPVNPTVKPILRHHPTADGVKYFNNGIKYFSNCIAVGIWAKTNYELITEWCRVNCVFDCPPDYCLCK